MHVFSVLLGPLVLVKVLLTDKVVKHYLDQGKKIGIVAIDPTSPFSGGGAILGTVFE